MLSTRIYHHFIRTLVTSCALIPFAWIFQQWINANYPLWLAFYVPIYLPVFAIIFPLSIWTWRNLWRPVPGQVAAELSQEARGISRTLAFLVYGDLWVHMWCAFWKYVHGEEEEESTALDSSRPMASSSSVQLIISTSTIQTSSQPVASSSSVQVSSQPITSNSSVQTFIVLAVVTPPSPQFLDILWDYLVIAVTAMYGRRATRSSPTIYWTEPLDSQVNKNAVDKLVRDFQNAVTAKCLVSKYASEVYKMRYGDDEVVYDDRLMAFEELRGTCITMLARMVPA